MVDWPLYDSRALLRIISLVEKMDNEVRFLLIGDLPEKVTAEKFSNLEIMPALGVDDLAKQLASCHLGICLLMDVPAMKRPFPQKLMTLSVQAYPYLRDRVGVG